MLSPDDRSLLVDLLSPPAGFALEHAIATTFTLDLTALLPVPLGFAGMDLSAGSDPIGVLHAVRNYADRMDVFCQAGMVSVPAQGNDLLSYLEPVVHQVAAPRPGRLFHPKIWLLRFGAPDGSRAFRFVCCSRNLTHDKSWDALVCLDGRRGTRPRAVNNPLRDLVRALPARTTHTLPAARLAAIEETAEELRFVEWERPDDTLTDDWLTFHVFGPGRRPQPNFSGRRRLIISPFLNTKGIERVWPDGDCTIVSRAESFDALDDEARGWIAENSVPMFVVDDAAAIPDPESEEVGTRWSLTGLHAKSYVVERDNRSHVFLGSANATDAAFGGNDEILVELVGKKARFGVTATVGATDPDGPKAETGFGRILRPHALGEQPNEDADADLLRRLESALCTLAALPLTATVDTSFEPEQGGEAVPQYGLTLTSEDVIDGWPEEAQLSVSLLTVPHLVAPHQRGTAAAHQWSPLAVEDITPFVVLRLEAGSSSRPVVASSVVMAQLVGDPPDRFDRVLARRLGTPGEFLRFLMLLLQLAGQAQPLLLAGGTGVGSNPFGMGAASGSGLLEALVTALAVQPAAIDDIGRLVDRLSATVEGRAVLPPGWDDLWASISAARAALVDEGER